jgi:SAM-dependent methyltransferase
MLERLVWEDREKDMGNNMYFSFVKKAVRKIRGYLPFTYDRLYYSALTEKYTPFAKDYVRILCDTFNPKSVIDIGCGVGLYLSEFERRGLEVCGYDGSKYAVKNSLPSLGVVKYHDLRRPLDCKRMYDLCLCIEVGEHLRATHARSFIEMLTKLSDIVCFTAAKPGQGGHHHINEQPPQYWEALFNQCGFILDHALTDGVKKMMRETNPLFTRGDIFVYENHLVFTKSLHKH